jgi:hypothetical protein
MVINAMQDVVILGTNDHRQKIEASWIVWVPFGVKEFAHTIEAPRQWILPILQT